MWLHLCELATLSYKHHVDCTNTLVAEHRCTCRHSTTIYLYPVVITRPDYSESLCLPPSGRLRVYASRKSAPCHIRCTRLTWRSPAFFRNAFPPLDGAPRSAQSPAMTQATAESAVTSHSTVRDILTGRCAFLIMCGLLPRLNLERSAFRYD